MARQIRTSPSHSQSEQPSSFLQQSSQSSHVSRSPRVKTEPQPSSTGFPALPPSRTLELYPENCIAHMESVNRILSIPDHRSPPRRFFLSHHLTVPQKCQQIYAEACMTPLPFGSKVFRFQQLHSPAGWSAEKFLDKMAQWQIQRIRQVRLGVTECEARWVGI